MKRDDFLKRTPEQNGWRFFLNLSLFSYFCFLILMLKTAMCLKIWRKKKQL